MNKHLTLRSGNPALNKNTFKNKDSIIVLVYKQNTLMEEVLRILKMKRRF